MSRIEAVDPSRTEGKTRENLAAVERMLGSAPNLFRVAARSPVALEAMVALFGATSRGSLKASHREAIAMTVAEANACDYCLSAHSAIGKGAGMLEQALADAREARASDPKLTAMLRLARDVVLWRGRVDESALAAVRSAGASDAEVLEVVANVALSVLTNYVNLVARTEIDFPVVRHGER